MKSFNFSACVERYPLIADLTALVLSAVLIHGVYSFYVFPEADRLMAGVATGETLPTRELAIVLKDPEQEICLIMGFWCLALLAFRYRLEEAEQSLIEADFTELRSSEQSLHAIRQRLSVADELAPGSVLVPAVSMTLDTYVASRSLEQAQAAGFDYCSLREEITDSSLTSVRYVLWAIPSIGFVGTVRGIGEALSRADEAMSGDIGGIAASLGVAFNSTFIALLVSLLLTLIANGLRGREQKRLVRCKTFIAGKFLLQLKAMEAQDAKMAIDKVDSHSIGDGALVP
jgi:biopolymer transport protein ExbB/TolQ